MYHQDSNDEAYHVSSSTTETTHINLHTTIQSFIDVKNSDILQCHIFFNYFFPTINKHIEAVHLGPCI